MKTRNYLLVWVMLLCGAVQTIKASGLGDIRVNARFLTDRMAFELKLDQMQYNDLFEVNFDFFSNIDPYLTGMACADGYALDTYYRYLDERNDDLRWILSQAEYARFLALDYFFRPVYASGSICFLRVYRIYPDRHHFHFACPPHYLTYRGAHGRRACGGVSFYRSHFPKRYSHRVYGGDFRSRPDFRKHDFAPSRPSGGPGYRFTPVRPEHPAAQPGVRPGRSSSRQEFSGNRPSGKSQTQPSRPARRPSADRKSQDRKETRPSVSGKRMPKSERPSVRSSRPSEKKTGRPSSSWRESKKGESGQTSRRSLRNL